MMTELKISAQNDDYALDLLCAEDYYKVQARRLQAVRFAMGVGSAAFGLLIFFLLDLASTTALVGIAATVIVIGLERAEKRFVQVAADIKEVFDTRLLGLPTSVLVAAPPNSEEIMHRAHARRFRRDALRDWYPPTDGIPPGFGRLLCQRASVVWDLRLRRRAGNVMLSVAALVFAGGIGAGLIYNLALAGYLSTLLAPTFPLAVSLVQSGWMHQEAGRERQRILHAIESTWRAALDVGADVDDVSVRTIQDAIWRVRGSAPVIPGVFQRALDRKFAQEMIVTGHRLKSEVAGAFRGSAGC